MGHEFSKLQCTGVDRHVLEHQYEDSNSTATPEGVLLSEEIFRTPPTSRSNSSSSLNGTPVIVFDWDDTLMCSSAVNQGRVSLGELAELEVAIDSILHTSMALGETMIVTNGNATWVQDSATRFLPRVLPTLAKVQVVSARALFERSYPGDPFMWKQAAFKHLLTKERYVTQESGLNLIALGDQMPEIEAAYTVVHDLGQTSRAKTLKFKEQPSIPELVGQIRRTERELAKLVAEDTSGHRSLVQRTLPEHLAGVVTQAAGWKLSEKTPDAWDASQRMSRPLSLKDFWPLFS